jgi:ATPase subunit of ABC transporter with duplicated ATPase domains
MAHLLGAEAVDVAFTGPPVLRDQSLGLADGDRIGVVGRNGGGKSTLLTVLAGRLRPDSGRVTRRSGVTVGLLEQQDTLDGAADVRSAVVGDRPDHVWASDARSREVMGALLADVPLTKRVDGLSGGQRRRVSLAAVLTGDWDVLFLDEPTNHLDLEAITWLAAHLKGRWAAGRGAMAVVTHDRWFLDEVAQTTWEVHDGVVEPFEGGYAAYVLQRVERDREAAASEARRRNVLRKELAWLRRGPPARTAKPKFRLDAAAALIADVPEARDPVRLARLAMTRLGRDVFELEDVSAGYGAAPPVLRGLDWTVGPGDRIGVLGANGAGKTTLLRVLTGDLTPVTGRIKRGKTVRTAWLSQAMAELEPLADLRTLDVLDRLKASYQSGGRRAGGWTGGGRGAAQSWASGTEELTPTALLERLGFTAPQLATPIRDLSGGQRRRLQLALTLMDEPNVLILDEPTNDLDTDMLAAIEDLLDGWPGTLLVVTHDRYLMERVTDRQFALLDGRLRHLPGGVDEYLRLATRSSPPDAAAPAPSPDDAPGPPGRAARQAKKSLAACERRLERLRADLDQMGARAAAADPTDWETVRSLTEELDGLGRAIAAEEERWLELAEAAGV